MGDFQGQTVNLPEGNPVISLLSPMSIHPGSKASLLTHPSMCDAVVLGLSSATSSRRPQHSRTCALAPVGSLGGTSGHQLG